MLELFSNNTKHLNLGKQIRVLYGCMHNSESENFNINCIIGFLSASFKCINKSFRVLYARIKHLNEQPRTQRFSFDAR